MQNPGQSAFAELSLRQLRCLREIADRGTLSAAAVTLNRTQSALSKSLAELERIVGVALFDRSARGVRLTPHGALLVARVREAEAQFKLAARVHRAYLRRPPRQRHNPVFTMEISRRRLAAFLAVHECGEVSRAAERLGVSCAAVYASLRVMEELLELPLFESDAGRMRSTNFAHELAACTSLAFSLIRHGMDEIASLDGDVQGRLVVGTLPYARATLVPRAFHRLLQKYPGLRVSTREGPYEVLERALRSGTIDMIIGATRRHDQVGALTAEHLFRDELAVICGARHPLASRGTVSVDELVNYGWVLPVPATPARQLFNRFLQRHQAPQPKEVIETGSLSMTRGLLLESDRLALLSAHQVQIEVTAGLLKILPVRLEETFRPIGITRRAHDTPSPGALALMAILRELAAAVLPAKPG